MASLKEQRPIRSEDDLLRYAITPRLNPLPAPSVGIFDEPYVCLKINGEWYSHVLGALVATLAQKDSWTDETRDFALNEIAKMLVGDACIVDCEQVEGCLEGSTIILNLQNAITLIQGENTAQDEEIERIKDEPTDGNIYPPAPAIATASACGAAWFIVEQFRAWIAAFEAAADTELTIHDAIDAIWQLDPNKLGNAVADILQGIFGSVVSVLTEFDTFAPLMREYLYCTSNNREDFRTFLTDNSLTEILAYLDCLTQSAWDRWVYLGGFDTSRDCSSYCAADFELVLGYSTGGNNGCGLGHTLTNIGASPANSAWTRYTFRTNANSVTIRGYNFGCSIKEIENRPFKFKRWGFHANAGGGAAGLSCNGGAWADNNTGFNTNTDQTITGIQLVTNTITPTYYIDVEAI